MQIILCLINVVFRFSRIVAKRSVFYSVYKEFDPFKFELAMTALNINSFELMVQKNTRT